jgi:hypothetical protein
MGGIDQPAAACHERLNDLASLGEFRGIVFEIEDDCGAYAYDRQRLSAVRDRARPERFLGSVDCARQPCERRCQRYASACGKHAAARRVGSRCHTMALSASGRRLTAAACTVRAGEPAMT